MLLMTSLTSCGGMLKLLMCSVVRNHGSGITESRSYATIPETDELHVANKRRKVTLAVYDFEWLDRDGLDLLMTQYDHLRDCFQRARAIVRQGPSRVQMNRILRPLLCVLADNEGDLNKLHSGEIGCDLSALFLLLCGRMFTFLDTVYEIGSFIKAKDKYAKVPETYQYPISPETRETVIRTKNFMSSPGLVSVLSEILAIDGHLADGYPLPLDMINHVILDMAAVEHSFIIPSYVMPNDFHRKLIAEVLPRMLETESGKTIPGSYPEIESGTGEEPVSISEHGDGNDTPNTGILSHSSPRPHIAKVNSTKTECVKVRLLAAKLSQTTPAGFRAKFYGRGDTHNASKEKYITNFEAKHPVNDHDIGAISSILKNRKTPKRLTMRRAPKSVRFTEGTLTTRGWTHMGLDVPKLFDTDEGLKSSFLVGDVQPMRPGLATRTFSSQGVDFDDIKSPELEHTSRNTESIFRRNRLHMSKKRSNDDIDPALAIENILSLPPIETLAISDDTKAGIAVKKERAAQKAAEEARKLAEQRTQKEREERLARSGGLRIPDQPLVSSLSSDWLARAHATLRAGAATTLATTAEGVDLRRHDFAKIVPPTEWLNDEIVNGSLNWLDHFINMAAGIKDVKNNTRKCLTMSSFFFKRLQEQGVTRTQRTLRRNGVDKNNLLDVDSILLPICEHSHWTLLVICPSKKTIAHIDSLNPRGSQQYIRLGLAWLKDILEEQFLDVDWKVVRHEAPMQTNGYDCGVHTITNGMCIALGLNPIDSYTSEDMPHQRLRLASMLLNGGFKGDFDLRVY
ncbi:hypothetical protein QQS21_001134 [Conoideocrella luteorostrata]|uniref:Ubiquitin-like protease family profile domain-containing protein n=1 Tax=Conoideocrella luteorostrata TaxID=1105319 RepID=A0AAJ0G297_9HYPO|nr:hypothetical protein QQS21_001134 [Conoideocrella luteorostrata]